MHHATQVTVREMKEAAQQEQQDFLAAGEPRSQAQRVLQACCA